MGKILLLPYNSALCEFTGIIIPVTPLIMAKDSDNEADKHFIISEAGRCVACNLCLPYCPTYQLTSLETESPRGRISLLSAMASDKLPATETLNELIHHCLLCRSCESHCPSSVSFAHLMDKGRYQLRQKLDKPPLWKRIRETFIDLLLRNPELIRVLAWFSLPFKFLPKSKKTDSCRTVTDYLPFVQPHGKWQKEYPAESSGKKLALFIGCVSRGADGRTLDDAIYVLTRTGFSVTIPPQQSCCGALPMHAGREAEAIRMMKKNEHAFADADIPIIYTATGCGMSLAASSDYLPEGIISARLDEVSRFIDEHWPNSLKPDAGKLTVLLHSPCSMENSSADAAAPLRLLSRFGGIQILIADDQYGCCGAAGTRMLTDISVSSRLRQPLMDQIAREMPDIVLTSNIGCALHIEQGLQTAGLDIPVRHPISLVAEVLRKTTD